MGFTSFNDCNSSSCSVFIHFHIDVDKEADCLESNSNASSNDLWLVFSTTRLFLKILFNKTSNKELRLFLFLISYLLLFCTSKLKLSHYEAVKLYHSVSKLRYKNLNLFSQLLLLSGDMPK